MKFSAFDFLCESTHVNPVVSEIFVEFGFKIEKIFGKKLEPAVS
jgi:hypothetical protein